MHRKGCKLYTTFIQRKLKDSTKVKAMRNFLLTPLDERASLSVLLFSLDTKVLPVGHGHLNSIAGQKAGQLLTNWAFLGDKLAKR